MSLGNIGVTAVDVCVCVCVRCSVYVKRLDTCALLKYLVCSHDTLHEPTAPKVSYIFKARLYSAAETVEVPVTAASETFHRELS